MIRLSVLLCVFALAALAACSSLSHRELESLKSRTMYTCCNIHYEHADFNDANYYVGALLPLGTPVQVESACYPHSVTFKVDSAEMTLYQDYGRGQESFQQYLEKVLVVDDPRRRVASFPSEVQQAIRESRVERGMTREQVILSVGYPPTHQTPSTAASEWTYWYSRVNTYKVVFDDTGKVVRVIGPGAPTEHLPINP